MDKRMNTETDNRLESCLEVAAAKGLEFYDIRGIAMHMTYFTVEAIVKVAGR